MPILQITGIPPEAQGILKLTQLRAALLKAVIGVKDLQLSEEEVDIDFLPTLLQTRLKCVVIGLFSIPEDKLRRIWPMRQDLAEAIGRVLKKYAQDYGLDFLEVLVPPYPNPESGYLRLTKQDIQD